MNSYSKNSIHKALTLDGYHVNRSVGLLFVILVALTFSACTGSKGLAKRAVQLEQAGLYSDAANFYFNALVRNPNNIEARIGLSNTSAKVFNDKLDAFSRSRAMDEHRSAYDNWQDAMRYRDKIARFGISHDIPSHMEDDFEYSKSMLLKELYEQGNDLMAEKRFDEAKAAFAQIAKIEPGYKDVGELKGVARNEPLYQKGAKYFDDGRYRSAYGYFDDIYRHDPGYRDVAVLREECLNLGRYPVALSPFENASGVKNIEKRVYAFFVTSLSQLDDPFLRIVERDNMEVILAEQRLSLSGIVDQSTASQVGNLLGAKALIRATVLSYSTNPGKVSRSDKDGFESYTVKLLNKETQKTYFETRYRPVKYSEYHQRNEARVSVQYQAISLESGEVLFSRIVDQTEEDQMYYAAYDGEVNNLFPAGANGVMASNRDRQRLQSLIRAPRTIRSVDELSNSAFSMAANELNRDLANYLSKQ